MHYPKFHKIGKSENRKFENQRESQANMFIISRFLEAFATVLSMVLMAYMWIIIIRALISWVNPDPYNPVVQFLNKATEPVLWRVRKRLPYLGGFDISPLIVILIIYFLQIFLIGIIRDVAAQLRMSYM